MHRVLVTRTLQLLQILLLLHLLTNLMLHRLKSITHNHSDHLNKIQNNLMRTCTIVKEKTCVTVILHIVNNKKLTVPLRVIMLNAKAKCVYFLHTYFCNKQHHTRKHITKTIILAMRVNLVN